MKYVCCQEPNWLYLLLSLIIYRITVLGWEDAERDLIGMLVWWQGFSEAEWFALPNLRPVHLMEHTFWSDITNSVGQAGIGGSACCD